MSTVTRDPTGAPPGLAASAVTLELGAGARPAAGDRTTIAAAAPPPPSTDGARAGSQGGRARRRGAALWLLRLPMALPYVFMGPELVSLALGRPSAVSNISSSEADVFGTSALLLFMMMLTVTPLHTVTGWRWHRPLRRDYGIGMFVVAMTDFVCAATMTGDTFPGGFLTRIGGHTFLLAGTLSTLLLVPLAMTASRRAQRWLGPHWKWLHRLVYVVWATVLLHLAFLFGFRSFFIDALLVSAPLALLRVPAVRDRFVTWRKARPHRALGFMAAGGLAAMYGTGYFLLARELVRAGLLAFSQHPSA